MTMCSPPVSHPDGEYSATNHGQGQSEASSVVMNIPVSVSNGGEDSRRERLVRWKAEQSSCANSVDSSSVVLVSPGGGGTHQVEDDEIEISDSPSQLGSLCNERKLVDDALAEYTKQLQARLEPKTASASKEWNRSVADIREELRRAEEKIFKAARVELALLNRSKKIRSKRESMTRRYKRLCQLLESRLKKESEEVEGVAPFVPACLPPVMPQAVYDLTHPDGL